jgi:YYY domain-containing protein
MFSQGDTLHRKGLSRGSALLLLGVILVVAGYLRFTGLNWDEGQYIHPDEGHMRNTLSLISWPDDLSLYFDTHRSPLNVRNREGRRYSYGTLPMFVARAAAEWLDGACASDPAPLSRAAASALIGSDVSECRPGAFTGVYNAVVGRTLSALADLGTLVLIYLIGRRLYGELTGLLAAALGAVTAFMIQQAHFFTVDSMACFFVTLVAYFSVRAALHRRYVGQAGARAEVSGATRVTASTWVTASTHWLDFALAGVSVGLAAACKVSAATAALLVVLAAVQAAVTTRGGRVPRRLRPLTRDAGDSEEADPDVGGTQAPAAEEGAGDRVPMRLPMRLRTRNRPGQPRWARLRPSTWAEEGTEGPAATRAHAPAHAKPPVDPGEAGRFRRLWGPALALCLAGALSLVAFRVAQPYAFEGPGFFGVRPSPEWFGRLQEIRLEQSGEVDLPSGRQWANRAPILFPWLNIVVWGMGLPLGLAGWIGWGVAGFELLSRRGQGRRHLVLWGWFTVVFLYHATQWVTSMRYFLALYPVLLVFAAMWLVRLTRSSAGSSPFLSLFRRSEDLRPVQWRRWVGLGLAAVVGLGAVFWGLAVFTIYVRPHPRLAASRWVYEHVPVGATVANEHWDWGLPLRVDGHDPFGGMYTGIEMQNYNEDTPQKRQQLYDWLDQADWIFLASNRLYGSIPRLPARYPLTIEYYRALFAGELGFELEADFASYPALGPFVFPDQENPFPLMEADYVSQERPIEVHLPPAEEAFSVYDHPRVLIFRKTEAYSSQLVEEVLDKVNLERVQRGRTPREATRAPDMLRFDAETWEAQQAGGTWSEMFNRDSLLNRYPGLAALAWWACVTVLGWLAFPLLFVSLPQLRDRGYGFARLLALLLIAYLTWLAASLRLFPNTRLTILRMVALLALAGVGVGWLRWDELKAFVRGRWRALLAVEGLFALLFAVWIGVRMLQPDLWHPVVGGEKPMDLAYLNAVMKSTWFPPYNPWLSGTWINYYYFGFVIVGTLIKLMGTVPSIAYNLVVPLLFAMTGVGAFSVAYNLSRSHSPDDDRDHQALLAGVLGCVFVVLVGNLGVVHLLRNKLIAAGGASFPSTIPGLPNAVSFLHGVWRVIVGKAHLGMRPETWYWHPTRIIPSEVGNPIAEFPAFTFLYGDLHAHMIAFPLTLFALALALAWVRTWRPRLGSLLIGGLVIGALRPTNTWDYPTYLLLGVVALGLGAWRRSPGEASDHKSDANEVEVLDRGSDTSLSREGELGEADHGCDASGLREGEIEASDPRFDASEVAGRDLGSPVGVFVRRVAWRVPLLVGLSVLLYLPYIAHYVTGYDSFKLWEGGSTPVGIYLWIYAPLLFPVATRLVVSVARRRGAKTSGGGGIPRLTAVLVIGVALVAGMALWMLKVWVALVAVPIVALAALLFFSGDRVDPVARTGAEETAGEGATGPDWSERLLWLLVTGAMMLSLGVELVVLEGDIGRMNTVFKFYLQVWILLSIAAAVSLAWVWRQARRWELGWRQLWWGVTAVLLLGAALFLPLGVRARAIDRMAASTGFTLDGMAFMKDAVIHDGPEDELQEISLSGDYHAIRWMQANVEGSPVILEGLGRREYLWANRVSIYTGLPAVVGWRWHQAQQRAGVGGEMVNWRRDDVNAFYDTTSVDRAEEILDRYAVRYVYVGAYERAYYDSSGLGKFDRMVDEGLLRLVYDAAGVRIYEMVD